MTTNNPESRRAMDTKLIEHQMQEEKRLVEIEQELKALKESVTSLRQDVSDLVTAWKAASWLVSLIKWLGGVAIAITALYNLFRLRG